MSHATAKMGAMNSRSRSPICSLVQLLWPHEGTLYRVGPWPDAECERLVLDTWHACEPDEDALLSAARSIPEDAWRDYLEYVPEPQRGLLARFHAGRIAVLLVLARCPDLTDDLVAIPALAAFVGAHRYLRGDPAVRWSEINAVHERAGIFGLLEWLGLPASRQTLAILRQIAHPDLPLRFLDPLRTSLWEPETLWSLQHRGPITGRFLERFFQPLAA